MKNFKNSFLASENKIVYHKNNQNPEFLEGRMLLNATQDENIWQYMAKMGGDISSGAISGFMSGITETISDVVEHPVANVCGVASGFIGALVGSQIVSELGSHLVPAALPLNLIQVEIGGADMQIDQNNPEGRAFIADVLGELVGYVANEDYQNFLVETLSQHQGLATPFMGPMIGDFADDLLLLQKSLKEISENTYDLAIDDSDQNNFKIYAEKIVDRSIDKQAGHLTQKTLQLALFSLLVNKSAPIMGESIKGIYSLLKSEKMKNMVNQFLPEFKNHIVENKLGRFIQLGAVSPYAAYNTGSMGYEWGLQFDHAMWGYQDIWGIQRSGDGFFGGLNTVTQQAFDYVVSGDWRMGDVAASVSEFMVKMVATQGVLAATNIFLDKVVSTNPLIGVPVKVGGNMLMTFFTQKSVGFAFNDIGFYMNEFSGYHHYYDHYNVGDVIRTGVNWMTDLTKYVSNSIYLPNFSGGHGATVEL